MGAKDFGPIQVCPQSRIGGLETMNRFAEHVMEEELTKKRCV
jgi:hypothetical protein